MSKLFVITVRIQVDSRPPAKERQSTIDRAQAAVVLEFFASLLLRPAQNRAQQGQEFDAFGITPELCLRRRPDLCNILGNHYWTVSGYKDRLGMLCGKRLSCLGGARLKDDWGSLGARLTQMWTGDVEVFALVVDFPHTAGIGVDSALTIEDNSIVSPGRLPQFSRKVTLAPCASAHRGLHTVPWTNDPPSIADEPNDMAAHRSS